MTPRKVGVLGPGATGGLLAAHLREAGHEVTVIATERTAIAMELTGLKLRTPHDEIETKPIARPWLTAPVEVPFVTTRATDLPAALERIPAALLATGTIVPPLNGIDHLPLLRARYPESRVVAASVSVEANRPRAGLTEQHSVGCELRVTADDRPAELEWSVDSLSGVPAWTRIPTLTRRGFCGRNSRASRRTRCPRPAPTLRLGRRGSATRTGWRLSPTGSRGRRP